MERRDGVLTAIADYIDQRNAQDADAGLAPALASPTTATRSSAPRGARVAPVRTRVPADVRELEPVVDRLVSGLLATSPHQP